MQIGSRESTSTPASPRKTVAVIAVHGVGDPGPFETVRRIGDLLQNVDIGEVLPEANVPAPPCAEPKPVLTSYYPFREQPVRISVRPTVVTDSAEYQTRPAAADGDVSHEFRREQLRCYSGEHPEDTYATLRLEGSRAKKTSTSDETAASEPDTDVHLYELYWADLSRPQATLLSILTDLYQILLHLPWLGMHAVESAAAVHSTWVWRRLKTAQQWATMLLTIVVPILILLMLGIAAVALGVIGLGKLSAAVSVSLIGAAAATVVTIALGRSLWGKKIAPALWLLPVILWLSIAGGVAAWAYIHRPAETPEWLRGVEALILAVAIGLLLSWIFRMYDQQRPGAARIAACLTPIVLLAGLGTFAANWPAENYVLILGLREFEALAGALALSWTVFFVLAIAAFLLGSWAIRSSKGRPGDDSARTCNTARLLLSLPTFSLLAVTLVLGSVVARIVQPWIKPVLFHSILPWTRAETLEAFINGLLTAPVESASPAILFLLGIAILPVVWGLAPVVLREVFPPEPYRALDGNRSRALGGWLTNSFYALACSGILACLAITFVLPGVALTNYVAELSKHVTMQRAGAVSIAAFGWFLAARGSLRKLALGFRPVLDILLDLDNWLRLYPADGNPAARIVGRYVSLLRYVCNWNDPITKKRYDRIVIMAHSQGTVITADVLRFLRTEAAAAQGMASYDPQLVRMDEIPIHLLTLGCPLRQLYGVRFPHLYGWARDERPQSMTSWIPKDLDTDRKPDPNDVGVTEWINAYRSGDYIGRNLWRSDQCDYRWDPDPIGSPVANPRRQNSSDGSRRLEFCIGAGAHTHYWDHTAPMVGLELDRLIAL